MKGKVVEVKRFAELAQLGTKNVQGKIVFFQSSDGSYFDEHFLAYKGAVDQPSEAAKYGAIGVIVRSLGISHEDYPHESAKAKIRNWKPLLEPYGLTDFMREGGGADVGPLGKQGALPIGYMPDSQRYFDYHDTPEDTFDKVNRRELELGSASIAALVYLIDQYGL